MSEHISEELAMVLAVLQEDDPEWRAARAHAQTCAACARLLERSVSANNRSGANPVDVEVDPRLKARILASVDRLEAERARRRWEPWAVSLGAAFSIALALVDLRARAGLFPARAPLCVMWLMLGATLSVAGAATWARSWTWQASPLRLGVVAMGGALIGQLWLRVRCPTHDAPLHVFTYHVTGVLLATLLGYLLARASWRSAR